MKNKTRKLRGRKTAGYGARKKHRGAGSRGGRGMAGSGKRADQKKTLILTKYGKSYYGKKGFTVPGKKYGREINLDQLSRKLPEFIKNGFAKKDKEVNVDLKKAGYTKLLGRGKLEEKYLIKIKSFSKKAKEKVEQLGGEITGIEIKNKVKEVKEIKADSQKK